MTATVDVPEGEQRLLDGQEARQRPGGYDNQPGGYQLTVASTAYSRVFALVRCAATPGGWRWVPR